MSQRRAVTKTIAARDKRADKVAKGEILDESCATTGWHRNRARKTLAAALKPSIVKLAPEGPDPEVRRGHRGGAGVLLGGARRPDREAAGTDDGRAGPPAAPVRGVGGHRRCRRRTGRDVGCDHRQASHGRPREAGPQGRSRTKPGSLLKDQIPISTWAQRDDIVPGFAEIDLVGHEGGNAAGEHCSTLTVTDIATGWTENRSVRNKARTWVITAVGEMGVPGRARRCRGPSPRTAGRWKV